MKNIIDLKVIGDAKVDIFDRIGIGAITTFLGRIGVTANHITIVHQIAHLLSAYFLFVDTKIFAILYLTHIVLDMYDGYFATKTNTRSALGEVLDHGFDGVGAILLLIRASLGGFLWLGVSTIILFFITLSIIFLRNKNGHYFPATHFPFFFIFELYGLGLIVNLIINIFFTAWILLQPSTRRNTQDSQTL